MTQDITIRSGGVERFNSKDEIEAGQWYWVTYKQEDHDYYIDSFLAYTHSVNQPDDKRLMCVTHVGSNYASFSHPKLEDRGSSYGETRVHFKDFDERCDRCEDPESQFKANIRFREAQHLRLMGEVQDMTNALAVSEPPKAILNGDKSDSTGLVAMTETPDLKGYKQALIKLKDEDLPAKCEEIKQNQLHLAKWMRAGIMSMSTVYGGLNKIINDRVFSIGLYAGFNEDAVKFHDGEPAPKSEPLHVFQRMLYCDEECLLDFDSGGMNFESLAEFNEWFARPKNRDRILPVPKSMVAMRIRRNTKDYSHVLNPWVRVGMENADKVTLLYIRNGEQLWCVETDLVFDEFIIPDETPLHLGTELMFKESSSKFMRVEEYEVMRDGRLAFDAAKAKFESDNPDVEKKVWDWHLPKHISDMEHKEFSISEWTVFNDDSVYFDDGWEALTKEGDKHNRIALILQGIIDRSEMLQPFESVKLWEGDDFQKHIKLVRDGRGTIHNGEPPDIEAYFEKLNSTIGMGSVVSGQNSSYVEKKREQWETSNVYRRDHESFSLPWGDNGPNEPDKITDWKPRAKKAKFGWTRTRRTYDRYGDEGDVPMSHTAHVSELMNYSAYELGDFVQFFEDPRTRAQYLKWAPALLSMERWKRKQMMEAS